MNKQRPPQASEPTWDGRERRRQGGGARPGAAVSLNAWLALSFVGASLIALALVPVLSNRRTQAIRTEIERVFQPARDLSGELETVMSSEMVALQGFLFSGEPRFRQAYRSAQRREGEIQEALSQLGDLADLDTQQRLGDLQTQAFQWHNNHAAALEGLTPRDSFMALLPDDQQRYEAVLAAIVDFGEELSQKVRTREAQLDRAARSQRQTTIALVVLALLSTLFVGVLARLLRRLAVRADEQRAEAVRVRRDIDAVLEATGDGVIGVDREGRCTFLNPAASHLLSLSGRDALDTDVHELVHGGDGECPGAKQCPLSCALKKREPARLLDLAFRRKGGGSFPVQCEVRPLLDGRRVRGMVLTFADLTESRETEQALKQAVQARDDVVAVVSHDLRGPVGTINAAAQLLLEVPLPEEQWREHIAAMERSSGRLSLLIRDLLDVTRIEAGALGVLPRPLLVDSLMDIVVQLAVPVARRRSVGLEREVATPSGSTVTVDRDRILQVFSNLVDNAVRYTPEGGTVRLEAAEAGDQVRFGVIDTGPGIPAAVQGQIFDRFHQLASPAKAGTGLGLAIVKGIVEAHGGQVWVESEEGAGAAFWFTLPMSPTEPRQDDEQPVGQAEPS